MSSFDERIQAQRISNTQRDPSKPTDKQVVVEEFSIYGDDEYAARPGQTPPGLPAPGTVIN